MYFHFRSPFTAATGGTVWRAVVDVPGAGDGTLPWVCVGVVDGFRLVRHRRGILNGCC